MKRILGLFLATVLLAAGCTHVYTPPPSKYGMEKIPEFSSQATVSLVNGQSNSEQVLFAENNGHDFLANYNEWTNTAIAITERELTKRGGTVAGGAGKSMTLSVLSSNVTTGGWGFRGYAKLHMVTSNGYERTYEGEAPAMNLYNAVSGALADAVVLMLSDTEIISYLSR